MIKLTAMTARRSGTASVSRRRMKRIMSTTDLLADLQEADQRFGGVEPFEVKDHPVDRFGCFAIEMQRREGKEFLSQLVIRHRVGVLALCYFDDCRQRAAIGKV